MSRPVTLFTIQWGDLSLEEVCKLAKQMGYEGLELSAAHLDMKRAATDPKYAEEVKATLKKYDLGCWALSNHLAGQCVCDTLPMIPVWTALHPRRSPASPRRSRSGRSTR